MSEDWDFYICRVDDKPASIYLDLGIAKEAPTAEFPFMAYIRIFMREPRPDGLSSQDEFESLVLIEDVLERELPLNSQAIYVGRNTSNGCRDLYFYSSQDQSWEAKVEKAMRQFPNYEYESGTRHDPEWGTYFGFLNPSEEDRERIENRRTCNSLEQNGDSLTKERPVEHWAYFATAESRASFVEMAAQLGYTLMATIEPESSTESYGVRISCVGIPSHNNIDSLTIPLFRAAKECGGNYDGWETEVVR